MFDVPRASVEQAVCDADFGDVVAVTIGWGDSGFRAVTRSWSNVALYCVPGGMQGRVRIGQVVAKAQI